MSNAGRVPFLFAMIRVLRSGLLCSYSLAASIIASAKDGCG